MLHDLCTDADTRMFDSITNYCKMQDGRRQEQRTSLGIGGAYSFWDGKAQEIQAITVG